MTQSVAVIQMVSQDVVDNNLAVARKLLRRAADQGARLAVLPENFAAMGRRDLRALGRAEGLGEGPVLPWLKAVARECGLWIVAGTLPLPPEGQPDAKPHASSLVVDDQGQIRARYDKLHLFDVEVSDGHRHYRESDDYVPGDRLVLVDTPVGRLGLSVCYDLRFPELYQALRGAGADLISMPAAFTAVTGAAHWSALIRARAIETQCVLLAANQGGRHPGPRDTHGHSAIVDAWGRVQAECQFGEAVAVAPFDAEEQRLIRQRMPVAAHRRFTMPVLAESGRTHE